MKRIQFAAAVLTAVLVAVPVFAARGKADFRQFVTLGDSLTLGDTNVAVVVTHQQFSWPAFFARQVGLRTDCTAANDKPNCFQQALISAPGLPPELELVSLQPLVLQLKPGQGAPINTALARPYNNLAIDGAELADAFQVDGDGNEAFSAPIVLRGLGSVVQQAIAQKPTFIAIWYGADDFFGPLQKADPAGLTPQATFVADYGKLLDQLTTGAPDAGMVVANLPQDVRKFPFVSVVPTVLVDPVTSQPIRDPNGNLIPLIGDLGGGTIGPLPAGSAIIFTGSTLLRTGYGIPSALKPLLPNLPDVGKPLPASVVLTPTEIDAFKTAIAGYNSAITSAAAARSIPVVDINTFFERGATGIALGPVTVNLSYLTGGIMSNDAAHPSDLGYLLIANQFIRTVNAAYGKKIPLAGLTQLFANNGAFFGAESVTGPSALEMTLPELTPEAVEAISGNYSPEK